MPVTLCLAITEPPRMAATMRMCDALGITEVVPLVTERVDTADLARFAGDGTDYKAIDEAVESLVKDGYAVIVLWEEAEDPNLVDLVATLAQSGSDMDRVAIVVGPRLGLTPAEVSDAVSAGAHVATIGASVVGNHTAAIAGLMILEHQSRIRE